MEQRRILALGLALWVAAGSGCVSYSSQPTSFSEVLSESEKTREVGAVLHGHILRIGARNVWTQEIRDTTEYEASYEFESFLGDDADTWWFYVCVSPVILPIDLVQFTLSMPFALVEHATDFDETYEHTQAESEPLPELAVQASSDTWTARAITGADGEALLDLSEAAVLALEAGRLLTYRWQAEGEVEHTHSLDMDGTFLAARGLCGPTPTERNAFWLGLAAKSPAGVVGTALKERAEWISPATLERYRSVQSLHPELTLSEVALWREHARTLSQAGASDHLAASNVLAELAQIVLRVDPAEADRLALRSLHRGAEYVVKGYYAVTPVAVYPHRSLVVFCETRLPLARRLGDSAASAVFHTVLALSSEWDSVARVNAADHEGWVIDFTDRAVIAVETRRAQEAAAREEAARRAAQARAEAERQAAEDAFHYRYLTGSGGGGYSSGSSSSSPSYSGSPAASSAPQQSEYQRMQTWRRDYEWKQAQTNRAFNQHR